MIRIRYPYMDEAEDAEAGAAGDDTGEAIGTGNAARLAMLDQINDHNDRERAGEFLDVVDADKGLTEEFVAKELSDDEQAAAEAKLQNHDDPDTRENLDRAAEEANAEPEPVADEMFTITVNGREVKLTKAQMLERVSKIEAADQYLAEAARIKREAEQGIAAQPSSDAANSEVNSEEDDLALARALQMGTEEEALAAVKKLRGKSSAPAMDPATLSRAVDDRLAFKEAANWFNTEYRDVFADPILKKMALDRDQDLLAKGDKREYRERYREIGDEVRTWVKSIRGEQKTADPAPDRQQRKAAAAVHAAPASAAARSPRAEDAEDKDEGPSAVIANMAKSRGGPQWMRN